HGYTELWQQCFDSAIQLTLAVIAARAIVADVGAILEFLRGDDLMTNADLLSQPAGVFDLAACDTRAIRRHGHRLLTERQISRLGHDRAIDAAAERHRHAVQTAQDLEQAFSL